MRKSTIFLCVLGFTSLIVGSVLVIPPIRAIVTSSFTIRSFGYVRYPDSAGTREVTSTTTLDIIGYLAVLASIGFFAIAFLRNRKPA